MDQAGPPLTYKIFLLSFESTFLTKPKLSSFLLKAFFFSFFVITVKLDEDGEIPMRQVLFNSMNFAVTLASNQKRDISGWYEQTGKETPAENKGC
ncbi:hypothetical protein AYK25_03795 [Thermoplasmatales archaeon SM1-50]|nr:MAG: hypothetical protein AYK25_03795 [Thermoplasmatales archaeon SM1-50]